MPRKSRKNVGLIGLGIIGSRVANALRLGGFHVYVWNRTPKAAPNFLGSPRQVAELCDVIQIFVSDAQALFDVLDGMGDALTPAHIILCNATVGPEATLEAARAVKDRGAQFLDAPFTGSKAAAEARELVYYIGGDDKTLQLAEPVLKASSRAIVKIGKIGDAAVVKVATNLISAVTVQMLGEAYAIVKSSGIPPTALAEALKQHAVRSGITDAKLANILDRNYEPHFSLKNMFKDVQLGIHIANALDIDMPATTATAGVMYGGLTRGWADEDFSVLARAYQKDEPAPPLPAPTGPTHTAPHAPTPSIIHSAAGPMLEPIAEGPMPMQMLPSKTAPSRESTSDELRNIGIILPEPVAKKLPESEKLQVSEKPLTDAPASPEKATPPTGSPVDKPAPAATTSAAKDATPEAPATGEAQQQHTPFVRLRRWFGTSSTN